MKVRSRRRAFGVEMHRTTRRFQLIFFVVFAAIMAYAIYGFATETGVAGYLIRKEVDFNGRVAPKLTVLLTLLVFSIPFAAIIKILEIIAPSLVYKDPNAPDQYKPGIMERLDSRRQANHISWKAILVVSAIPILVGVAVVPAFYYFGSSYGDIVTSAGIGLGLSAFLFLTMVAVKFSVELNSERRQRKTQPGAPSTGDRGASNSSMDSTPILQRTATILGIDLGTTQSVVGVIIDGRPAIIPTAAGASATPTMVAFGSNGERYVGMDARRQAVLNLARTFSSLTRKLESGSGAKVDGRHYSPVELLSIVLVKLKTDAESYLGQSVRQVVVTVPTCYDMGQREAVRLAGAMAGLEVMRLVSESAVAAMAYGFNITKPETILVYSLGGGYFEASVCEVGDGLVEVRASAGDPHLGGEDFDERLMSLAADHFQQREGIDVRTDPQAVQRLLEACQQAKIDLSSQLETEINLPNIVPVAAPGVHLRFKISRARFEELTFSLIERTRCHLDRVVKCAGLTPAGIDRIVLIGGASRMPAVTECIKKWAGKDPYRGISPDEAPAIGAAIQAGVLNGDVKDMLLMEVNSLALGMETEGGVFTEVIACSTLLPVRRTGTVTTASDYQTTAQIRVLEGTQPVAARNRLLGVLTLEGIRPQPMGGAQIRVTFDIDANRVLHVSAEEKGTGKRQTLTVPSSGWSPSNSRDAPRKASSSIRFIPASDKT